MILLDADVLLIDIRYPRDPRFSVNRQVLDQLRTGQLSAGITSQSLLEVVGVLSFNVAPPRIPRLVHLIPIQYALVVTPDLVQFPDYASCSIAEIVAQISHQMALGDAVQAAQIDKYAPHASRLLTWNAKHFAGKLAVPVQTPQDWIAQQRKP